MLKVDQCVRWGLRRDQKFIFLSVGARNSYLRTFNCYRYARGENPLADNGGGTTAKVPVDQKSSLWPWGTCGEPAFDPYPLHGSTFCNGYDLQCSA